MAAQWAASSVVGTEYSMVVSSAVYWVGRRAAPMDLYSAVSWVDWMVHSMVAH